MLNAVQAVKLLRENGLHGVGGFDGCLCTHFSIQGCKIAVSCRKSDGAKPKGFCGIMVRVYSNSLDTIPSNLRMVAEEVVRQIKLEEDESPLIVRFCSYEIDHEQRCVYCEEAREDESSYLCNRCQVGNDSFGENIAANRDYRVIEWVP